ncbi:hypothetical protein RM543_12360 [Roseicyclus sp. F158]|uniref:Uncharacterized protein n=1 Tax=Tropicimonas omnivorans TaxID=3075590 RepID=A0ABU3DIH0_9RHOB|nr:hypothetical protein [Roseicyclus sp. F158]MDT0683481.1 hypothetical protein [Roseicyclus sp. F158]
MRCLLVVPVALTLFAFAPGAVAEIWDCDLAEQGTRHGYVPERTTLQIFDDGSGILVSDEITGQVSDRPILGRIASQSGPRVSLHWEVYGLKSATRQYLPKVMYRAGLRRDTGGIAVLVQAAGFSEIFRGAGRCERR